MNRTVAGCLIAFLVIALLGSLALNGVQVLALMGSGLASEVVRPKPKLTEQLEVEAKSGSADKVVQIDLEGIITSAEVGGLMGSAFPMVDTIKRSLEQAVADAEVKAIVLHINSPGGEVTASDILYAAVKKAAEKKPVVIYMDSMAASGGYYIACGGSRIVASETTLTASIGVIMESFSYHELFGKVGLNVNTFTSGAFKDSLSGARPMRDDEKAYVQNLVNVMYDRFLGIVADARKLPKDELRNTVADGRVVTGRQALEAKLVDQIGYIEDAYATARELGKAPNAAVVKYQSAPAFLSALGLATSRTLAQKPTELKVDFTGSPLPKLQPGMLYYLPSLFAR